MKKICFFLILFNIIISYCFSQDVKNVTIEITNVTVRGGMVYLAIFTDAEEFRKEEPKYMFELEDISTVLSQVVTLPHGYYLISAFQDANDNKQLDFGFLGIPRELVAMSNYDGRGLPTRNFDRQKTAVNSATDKISVGLHKF